MGEAKDGGATEALSWCCIDFFFSSITFTQLLEVSPSGFSWFCTRVISLGEGRRLEHPLNRRSPHKDIS